MSMMDFYDNKSADIALEEVLAAKQEFLVQMKTLDIMEFILRYYLETGEMLNPSVFGLEEDTGDEDDE